MSRSVIVLLTLAGLIAALCVVLTIGSFIALAVCGGDIPEPDVSDLALERPAFAEEENAYAVYEEAIQGLHWPEDDTWVWDYLDGLPVEESRVAELLARNGAALETFKQAHTHTHCYFPIVDKLETSHDYVSWERMMFLLSVKARHDRLSGRFTGAADVVEALLYTGRHIHTNTESMMVHFTGKDYLCEGVSQAADLAKDQDVPRELLDRLATALDQYPEIGEGIVRVIKGEFHSSLRVSEKLLEMDLDDDSPYAAMPKGNHANPLAGIMLQTNRNMRDSAELHRQLITMVPLTYAEAKAQAPDKLKKWETDSFVTTMMRPNFMGRLIYSSSAKAFPSLHASKCWTDSHIAGTRLLVALIRHKADTGVLPEELDALVPQYIESIPADPYDGKPFRYSREKGIVYAVGLDLQDSGGSTAPLDSQDMREHAYYQLVEDVVFPLS